MPSISYDGQSFIIDGQRAWLVSGTIDYARLTEAMWPDRLRAARQAGLNTLFTTAFWNYHEPQPGSFRFDGRADLHRFIELAADQDFHVVLRAGPFVGAGWDFGGLPPWLHETPGIRLRQAHPVFLQTVARYLDALIRQVNDLQATKGGPLLAVQIEHQWFCHYDDQAEAYLGQLTRFLREAGCRVPILNTNNLWQPVDGTLDAWSDDSDPLALGRQLHVVRPNAPRLITDLRTAETQTWGQARPQPPQPQSLMRTLCLATASGSQFNLAPFAAPTHFAFFSGRLDDDRFLTSSACPDAPLSPTGRRNPTYFAVKRMATFLSRHADLLAHMTSDGHHATATSDVSVIQQTAPLGKLVFLVKQDDSKARSVDLLTPTGEHLTVYFGHDLAAWILLDASLAGKATLDLTNLRPWALIDERLLVLFGPARTEALVSINGARFTDTVPAGRIPLVVEHQGITLCLCNEAQIDSAYIHGEELYVGIDGFDEHDQPRPLGSAATAHVVASDASVRRIRLDRSPSGRLIAPRLGAWQAAAATEYINASSSHFAAIDGPRSLEHCAADFGYGWYRVQWSVPAARKINLLAPGAADRLHLYEKGHLKTVLGFGPGAQSVNQPVPLTLAAGENTWVFLADNLGRFAHGTGLGESKGLFDHLYHVKPIRLPSPQTQTLAPPDPFVLSDFIAGLRHGDTTARPRYSWTIDHRRKTPLVVVLDGHRPLAAVLLNDQLIALDADEKVSTRLVLQPDQLRRGRNVITLAPLADPPARFHPQRIARFYEAVDTLTADAKWAFARWRMPDDDRYADLPARPRPAPTWFVTTFKIRHTAAPLLLELHGVTKGQVYLNGRNLGRYFIATVTGKSVPPQRRCYLPESWLNIDGENQLTLFDEHGKVPTRCKLVYEKP